MVLTKNDIVGERNTERRIQVILAHMKKPGGLAVVDLLHELNLTEKDRTGIESNHLKPLIKAGVLEECTAIPERGKQKKLLPRVAYRLKNDLPTLQTLIKIFNHEPVAQHKSIRCEFMLSPFCWAMTPAIASEFNACLQSIELCMVDIEHAGEPPETIERNKKVCNKLSEEVPEILRKYVRKQVEPIRTFTDVELREIINGLRSNLSMLEFVVDLLLADDETKERLMFQVACDACSKTPTGCKLMGVKIIGGLILKNVGSKYGASKEAEEIITHIIPHAMRDAEKQLLDTVGKPPRMLFTELFDIVEYVRSKY